MSKGLYMTGRHQGLLGCEPPVAAQAAAPSPVGNNGHAGNEWPLEPNDNKLNRVH